ncbi:MAG TPA: class II glutamine amidotransferase [Anaeromyxobacter sp.]|nr:class II glutamine amidotransferase [Anaeromyxobacter sp.]
MPNLLAISFEGELAPSFDLRCLRPHGALPDGWGIGYYPGGEPSASVLKEPAPRAGSIRSQLVEAWEHLEASLFVLQIRQATWGAISDANTQPFTRAWGRRDWLFAHAGSLLSRPELDRDATFEPVGSTDTEFIFCELMNRVAECGWTSIGDADLDTLRSWLKSLNELGTLTAVLSDGHDLCLYADREGQIPFHYREVVPPHGDLVFEDDDLVVDLARRGVKSRRGVVAATSPMSVRGNERGEWRRLPPGHLLVVRQGVVRAEATPPGASSAPPAGSWKARRGMARPAKAEVRRYDVRHRTVYRYTRPVDRSMHLFRLTPVHDRLQSVLSHSISVSVDGAWRDYEDVFGNVVRRLLIDSPYSELAIEARSRVELLDTDPLSYRPLRARTTFPLVFMPWHQEVLRPFLLPPELPESQLTELAEYAMSFVDRNDSDLLDTLLDMNHSIFRDYEYVPGATTVQTDAFEVYARRRGVCQDFTNLFICLARLLGVPARYVCGYIRTQRAADARQADASHAWVQVYLPEVGWKGFDPTNGLLTQTEHVRVAVGRHSLDATPTSGVIYVGGGGETLDVSVEVVDAT